MRRLLYGAGWGELGRRKLRALALSHTASVRRGTAYSHSEAQASEVSTVRFPRRARIFEIWKSRKMVSV
eukprot:scaffold127787_cov27-Phaeocystis_antarctica.AAC.1